MSTHTITVLGFTAIAIALIALELVARRRGSRVPTAGQMIGFLMQTRITRLLILLLWGWLGWHFFAR
ncbi:MAG TPA: DUF6186 family protein [Streptosporangiaceae bacterium]|nr:DUF6186 family protein [Streptosporangiaceae bacterium]